MMDATTIARIACRLCAMAYTDGVSGLKKIDELPNTQILCTTLQNPAAGSSCLLGSFEVNMNKYLVIAFRGTDAMSDWGYNLSIIKKRVTNPNDTRWFVPRVHGGFLLQYNSLKCCLNDEMCHYESDVQIIVTGHSLGGALACVCAHDLIQNSARHNKQINLVTFGCPRPGNREFKTDIEANIDALRVVNGNDIVAYTPLINAYHVGVIKQIGVCGTPFPSVADHSVECYQVSLAQQASQESLQQPGPAGQD